LGLEDRANLTPPGPGSGGNFALGRTFFHDFIESLACYNYQNYLALSDISVLGITFFLLLRLKFAIMARNLTQTMRNNLRKKVKLAAAFALVEAMVGVSVLGVGIASTVGALTKFNSIASTSRNATGACTAVMNQIDLIQSDGPFNPRVKNPDGTAQIPPELQLGAQTQNNVSVYQDPDTGVLVSGTMTTTVTDISSTYTQNGQIFPITQYQAVVTLAYTYLNRNYSFSMSTIRTSDI
jgi:type II secretory pathway pseudopilin PulG